LPSDDAQQPKTNSASETGTSKSGLLTDLSTMDVLIAFAKQMNSFDTQVLLQHQRARPLREVARSDLAMNTLATTFLQEQSKDIEQLQQLARLEDASKRRLKHYTAMQKTMAVAKRVAKRSKPQATPSLASDSKSLVPPPSLASPPPPRPPSAPATSAAVGDGVPVVFAQAPAVELALPVELAADPSAHLAGGPPLPPPYLPPPDLGPPSHVLEDIEHKGKPDNYKKDKKDKSMHKKKKHLLSAKPHKIKTSELPKPIVPADIFISVDFDTELKLHRTLERLAREWDHPLKKQLLLWLARDIHADVRQCRKPNMMKHKAISKYLRRPLSSAETAPGVAAKTILGRIKNLPPAQRAAWLDRRCADMLAQEAPKT